MATFHFELVSPDKVAFSGQVDQVDVPGAEGDFGVLAGHAPLIALLRPGLMTVYAGGEQTKLVVLGGFAEVGPDGLTVLADVATTLDDLDRDVLQAQIEKMETRDKEMGGLGARSRDRQARPFQDAGCASAGHGDALTFRFGRDDERGLQGRVFISSRIFRLNYFTYFENAFTTCS